MDSGDKGTNKAMSAAYKYAAFQAFSIPTEADNDADGHTHHVVGQAESYEAKHLHTMQEAALNGTAALQEAFGSLPVPADLKNAFWAKHSKSLKSAAKSADQQVTA
jgi:hypothetical protein